MGEECIVCGARLERDTTRKICRLCRYKYNKEEQMIPKRWAECIGRNWLTEEEWAKYAKVRMAFVQRTADFFEDEERMKKECETLQKDIDAVTDELIEDITEKRQKSEERKKDINCQREQRRQSSRGFMPSLSEFI